MCFLKAVHASMCLHIQIQLLLTLGYTPIAFFLNKLFFCSLKFLNSAFKNLYRLNCRLIQEKYLMVEKSTIADGTAVPSSIVQYYFFSSFFTSLKKIC
jgi:hypothetical protein